MDRSTQLILKSAYEGATSGYSQQRLADEGLDHIFALKIYLKFAVEQNLARMSRKCITHAKALSHQEMEYIAIRENTKRAEMKDEILKQRHQGQSFGAQIYRSWPVSNMPEQITPEFVRKEVAEGRAIIPSLISIIPNQSQ